MPGTPRTRRWPKVVGGLVLVLVVVVVVAVLALDRILLSQVRQQADALSRDLGRPIVVEGVATKLLGGFGAKVSGVTVGPGEGEELPLLELRRAEVEASLWRALTSRGSVVEIDEAVLEGLRVNVVKLPDGSTNLERLSRRLEERSARAAEAPEQPAPEAAQEPADLSAVRVDRAAVENARIAFVDRTVPGAKELFVEDLDVEVRDLRAGQPLALTLRAAVLAQEQNLELLVRAAPLPKTLVPTPEEVTLRVKPIDLGPLAPFVPAAGFQGGRLAADLAVVLGGAVPGGEGRTSVKGNLAATDLAFAGQEGGRRLDVRLEADLEADARAGDLVITKLDLAAGPAGVTGTGRVTGFTSAEPRVEGLRLVARGLDPTALQAYYPPLRQQLGGVVVDGPVGLVVEGSGSGATQSIVLRVDLGPVRLAVPQQLTKAAGAPATLVVRADASKGGEAIRYDAALDLRGVDLRPGGTLAKGPGDPLSVNAAGSYAASGGKQELALSKLSVNLLGDVLAGRAQVTLAGTERRPTTTFSAEVSGERLDLDRLLAAPEDEAGKKPAEAEASKPLDPATFAGLSGTATVKLGLLRMQKVEARDVLLRIQVQEDAVTLQEARLDAFGGGVSAAGTAVRLASPEAPFKVVAKLEGVRGEEVLALFSKHKVLGGKLDAALELGGQGTKLDPLKTSLTGTLGGTLHDGAFYGKDLVAGVAAPLAKKLPFAAGKIPEGGATALGKQLPFSFEIKDGVARLTKPLAFESGGNGISVDGGVRLDGTLDMPTTVALSPELVGRLTGGRARLKEPVPVGFRLSGAAWSPRLDGLALDGAARSIAQQAVGGAVGKALGAEGESAQEVVAEKKAEVEERARKEADEARKKAEEEAKKRLRGLFGR